MCRFTANEIYVPHKKLSYQIMDFKSLRVGDVDPELNKTVTKPIVRKRCFSTVSTRNARMSRVGPTKSSGGAHFVNRGTEEEQSQGAAQ
jgi:hypothetical protein